MLWTDEPGGLESCGCKESDTSDWLLKHIFSQFLTVKHILKFVQKSSVVVGGDSESREIITYKLIVLGLTSVY